MKEVAYLLPLSILVERHKNKKLISILSNPALALFFLCLIISPSYAHAGIISSLADKIKAFVINDTENQGEALTSTAQTMPVLNPVVVSEDSTSESEDSSSTESLSVTTGSMRLSTEDIDFPLNDTISVYEVKKGDTIASVAALFKVSKNTILWANDIKNNTISAGDTLVILPITGIRHTVKKGDTLVSIAKKYKADGDDLARYNGVTKDSSLAIGDVVLVPEGEIAVASPVVAKNTTLKKVTKKLTTAGLGFFVRPLATYIKTQGIHGHNAVDLAAKVGTPIVATAKGKVIVVKTGGYDGGYGNMIVISHENNIQTLYAHLSEVYVSQGATVTQGQVIGTVGSTGRSTGPHLHIEVRGAVNPF